MHLATRLPATEALAFRAALISALLALPVSVANAATAPCTVTGTHRNDVFIVVADTPDAPGEVAVDAVICGKDGDDVLEAQDPSLAVFTGKFYGGKGNDVVGSFNQFDGTFFGRDGDDRMNGLVGAGLFEGGPGNDQLAFLIGGTFKGGSGNDAILELLFSGSFIAGGGADHVFQQQGGSYHGGLGIDTLETLCGGTQKSVEVIVGIC